MKTFAECCDEVAKKYNVKPFNKFIHPVLSAPAHEWYAEAAELYNSETAKERDHLKEKVSELKSKLDKEVERQATDNSFAIAESEEGIHQQYRQKISEFKASIYDLKEENESLRKSKSSNRGSI